MILHTDIPTRQQVERLLRARDPASVSIYVPTDPASSGQAERIEFDIDEVVPGSIDERTGSVAFGEAGPDRYGIVDEIARRVWLAGGRVLAVRSDEIPGRGPVAAILRYAPALT